MKYAAEMTSGAMIYVLGSIKAGSGVQKLLQGNSHAHRPTDSKAIS
jgi:hypothetical protein